MSQQSSFLEDSNSDGSTDSTSKTFTGDELISCIICAHDFESSNCHLTCDLCRKGLKAPCSVCGRLGYSGDEDSPENVHMSWDSQDGIWRCTICFWEVEIYDDDEGKCSCSEASDVSRRRTFFAIKASKDSEYEGLVIVDLSESDSSESEDESEFQGFIDDDHDVGLKPGGHMGPLRPLGILYPDTPSLRALGDLVPEDTDEEMDKEMDEAVDE